MAASEAQNRNEPEPANFGPCASHEVHPAWLAFMRFCRELRHGEIEQLKIQDGLPLLSEVTKKKVKFT